MHFGTVIPVKGITVTPKKDSVGVNKKITLSAVITPSNADTLTYTWTSVNPAIATVDQNGNVSGVKIGSTKIYVKSTDRGYSDTCLVAVISNAGIQVIKDDINLIFSLILLNLNYSYNLRPSNQSVISVYSSIGQLVLSKSFANNVGMNTLSIPVGNLPNGIYAIIIENYNIMSTKKFIKE